MPRRITATITVQGDAVLLAAYRSRANELLDAESGEPYRELHTDRQLDWRVKGAGVPYPPFVTASAEIPELVVEVRWERDGAGGRATIQAGRVTEQSAATAPEPTSACEVRVDRDGTLVIAVVCRRGQAGDWIGYAVTASQHGFFRVERRGDEALLETTLEATDGVDGEWAERWTIAGERAAYAELDPREPVDPRLVSELDRLANDFADEWIWFDESPAEATAVERSRYASYGLKVGAANVRSLKLRTELREMPGGGYTLELEDPEARAVTALVARHWLQTARH